MIPKIEQIYKNFENEHISYGRGNETYVMWRSTSSGTLTFRFGYIKSIDQGSNTHLTLKLHCPRWKNMNIGKAIIDEEDKRSKEHFNKYTGIHWKIGDILKREKIFHYFPIDYSVLFTLPKKDDFNSIWTPNELIIQIRIN